MSLRLCLESILNLRLEERSWTLASLPIKFGGLGVRRISDVCLPAFLSSAFGVLDFVKSLHLTQGDEVEICHVSEAMDNWTVLSSDQTIPDSPEVQRNWDVINVSRVFQSLLSTSSDADRARYLAIKEKESGAWLNTLPSSNVGTFMDNLSFKVAVALRLGSKFCIPHKCICGVSVDAYGHHGLSCQKNYGRFARHFMLNDIIKRALVTAGFPSVLEPVGISRSDGKRPDGVTLIPWTRGKSLLWDATCADTLAPSHLQNTCKVAGSAASSAATLKKNKYKDLVDSYHFVPFAVESLGVWSSEAKSLISDIGKILTNINGDSRSTEFLRQKISIAIQRGNATSIMSTFPETKKLEEIFYFLSDNRSP